MLNKIILKGNIGRSPEIKLTQDGKTFVTFCLATNLTWRDLSGEWQTHTDWHRIAVFRDASVRWIKDTLKKGDAVYVEGRLAYNSWKDKYHQTRITPQVVVENWQGHIEHLRRSKSSFHEEGVEEEDYDQKDSQLMEESLSDLSPLSSFQKWGDEERPFFQGYSWHSSLVQENRSGVDQTEEDPHRVEHFVVDHSQERTSRTNIL